MHLLLKPFSNKIFYQNKIFDIDNGDNIFFGFKKRLKKINIEIDTIDKGNVSKAKKIIFCDIPYFWEIKNWFYLLFNKNKSILFCFESPLVNPFSHKKIFFSLFSSVYTWNDDFVDNKKIHKFNLPIFKSGGTKLAVPFKRKKLISVINSNKSIPYPFLFISKYKMDLYPHRVKVISFLEKNAPQDFDLYGRGWNEPKKFSLKEKIFGYKKFFSFKGSIPRKSGAKINILKKYKFNLCFENCRANGYISEKIIDCLKAKTVPIYLGAPNIDKYFPRDTFIDFRRFQNLESMLKYIKNMPEKKYNQFIINGQKLLKLKKFQKAWYEIGFLNIFLQSIKVNSFGQ